MTPWLQDPDVTLYHGDNLDVLRQLPDRSVHMCATSPPFYGLRDYNADGQIGLEDTPDQWVERLVLVFREVRRVLRDDGTLWVEIGDSYASGEVGRHDSRTARDYGARMDGPRQNTGRAHPTKQKDLIGQPWLLAFALRADGWYLRSEIIWARPNPMPESVTDRPTKSHSTVFLLSKQPRYFYDADAIREPLGENTHHQHVFSDPGNGVTPPGTPPHSEAHGDRRLATGRNIRSVWTVPTQPTPFAHFATWPEALVRRMILAGTSERGCCPECGAPWTRDVERGESDYERLGKQNGKDFGRADSQPGNSGQTRTATGAVPSLTPGGGVTVGWSPSCRCIEQMGSLEEPSGVPFPTPVPCTVLDPFAGSATTMLVARNHGRHSIGIELNADYLQIAARRLQQLTLLA